MGPGTGSYDFDEIRTETTIAEKVEMKHKLTEEQIDDVASKSTDDKVAIEFCRVYKSSIRGERFRRAAMIALSGSMMGLGWARMFPSSGWQSNGWLGLAVFALGLVAVFNEAIRGD